MSTPTISVVAIMQNEAPFLRAWLPLVHEWADEVVLLDTGSTDESADLARQWKRPQDVVLQTGALAIPLRGYADVRNEAGARATGEWLHILDIDEAVPHDQVPRIRDVLAAATSPVLSITTVTFEADGSEAGRMMHRRFLRRSARITFRGYIHEEPYQGAVNSARFVQKTDLLHLHWTNYRPADPAEKEERYAWMLLRGYRDEHYREWVNRWWFTHHVPKYLADITQKAERYAARYPELPALPPVTTEAVA